MHCRVFVWGARSGVEQLPPFPEPSHNAVKQRHSVPSYVKHWCVVDFQSVGARQEAMPWVRTCLLCSLQLRLHAVVEFLAEHLLEHMSLLQTCVTVMQIWQCSSTCMSATFYRCHFVSCSVHQESRQNRHLSPKNVTIQGLTVAYFDVATCLYIQFKHYMYICTYVHVWSYFACVLFVIFVTSLYIM